jgi:hypothetical protein
MAYSQNFLASARRHLHAADHLDGTHRRDVAGYLYGVAAECALKEMMRQSGMRPLPIERKREDPFYAHFKSLKTLLRDQVKGRRQGELLKYATDPKFMQQWDTDMRYAPGTDIQSAWIDSWRDQARKIVQEL